MTSQGGQRFRRRALRRGYKVDEVDSFLDRVEATLNGDQIDIPVTAQEAHDVVFRVRFGGYDEWQVDLHLDRLERQLTELEEQQQQGVDNSLRGAEEPVAPPQLPAPPPMRALPPGPAVEERPVFEQPVPTDEHNYAAPVQVRDDFPTQSFPNVVASVVPVMPPAPVAPPEVISPPVVVPTIVPQSRSGSGEFPRAEQTSIVSGDYDIAGRHGRMDMTAEMGTVTGVYTPDEIAKIDALRRTFQPRRFGSGYDTAQVDRLFDAIMAFMTGRTAASVTDGELDPTQFNLVQGGYFEAEVDAALRETRELFSRTR